MYDIARPDGSRAGVAGPAAAAGAQSGLLLLQRQAGNLAVARMMRGLATRTALTAAGSGALPLVPKRRAWIVPSGKHPGAYFVHPGGPSEWPATLPPDGALSLGSYQEIPGEAIERLRLTEVRWHVVPESAVKQYLPDPTVVHPWAAGRPGPVEGPPSPAEIRAVAAVKRDPRSGAKVLPTVMKDPRWLAADGWLKMEKSVDDIVVHFVWNPGTDAIDDIKIKRLPWVGATNPAGAGGTSAAGASGSSS